MTVRRRTEGTHHLHRAPAAAKVGKPAKPAPESRLTMEAWLPPEYQQKLGAFVGRLHKDIKVTVMQAKSGDWVHEVNCSPLRMKLEVPGAEAQYVFADPAAEVAMGGPAADFGSRAWGYQMASKMIDFDRAYREGRIGEFLVSGNAGGASYGGAKVSDALRQRDRGDF